MEPAVRLKAGRVTLGAMTDKSSAAPSDAKSAPDKPKNPPVIKVKNYVKGFGDRKVVEKTGKEESDASNKRQKTNPEKKDDKPKGKGDARKTFEEKVQSKSSESFLTKAAEEAKVVYTTGNVNPSRYLQLGTMFAEVNFETYLESCFSTGAQRPKCRSLPGLVHLHDAHAFHLFVIREYLDKKIPVYDFENGRFSALSYPNQQELKARINSAICTEGRSVIRSVTSTEEYEQLDGSKDMISPYRSDLYGEVPADGNLGADWTGENAVVDGRLMYNEAEQLTYLTSLGPREVSIMEVALINDYGFDEARTFAIACHWGEALVGEDWLMSRYEPFRRLYNSPLENGMRQFKLEWQQNLVATMTSRHSLYSLPDISRTDTVAMLNLFDDNHRLQLLREISGAYQLEGQKAHWAEDADGACVKIKAHQQPHTTMDLLDLYHVLGNMMADQQAKTTCLELNEPWRKELDKFHGEIQQERNMLHDVFKLHVELFKARSVAAQQMSRLEDENLPTDGRANLKPVLQAFKLWNPEQTQQLTFPQRNEWFEYFSWGSFLAEQMYLWMQTTVWPVEPGGPIQREVGVSWLELGISFSMYLQQALPILRTNAQGSTRLLLIKDENDVLEYAVTYTDVAATMQKMWCQCEGRRSMAGAVRATRSDATYASAVTEATHEEKEGKGLEGAGDNGYAYAQAKGSKEKTMNVVSFVMLQTVLKQESTDHRSAELKLYADQLEQSAQEIVKDIQQLQKEEDSLRKLEAQLSDSLKMNLRWFRGLIVPDASSTLVDARMPHHLSSYAKMCWILQHQASYLTQLSQYIHGDEAEIFLDAIDALFGDVKDERQVHLFNSLQTSMIAKEAENAGGSPEKFMDKNDSVSFMVFSQRALRQAFAKEILFPFLGSKDPTRSWSWWDPSAAQLKEKLGSDGKGKDEVELNNIYSLSLNAFRDFLTGGFLKIIRKIQLPRSLRLAMRQDKLADIDDKEQRPYQPALRLFCYGIIEPIMREGARYAVPANFLKKSQQDYKPDDPQIASNFDCVADFLDQMLSNTIDPKESLGCQALMSAARLVKEELLTFVKQQSEVEDTTGSDILAAVLNSHYSRAKSFVTMSQAQIMKLSNLLKEWSSKLRIKEFDPLGACIQSVPEWDKESIMISERYEVRLNFEIDTRFLMTAEEILLCKQSMCPLPAWACSAQTSPRLVYIEEEAAGNDQGWIGIPGSWSLKL
eukprot:s1433_g3.t1